MERIDVAEALRGAVDLHCHSVLASNLGQQGRPMPVDGLMRVSQLMVDRGPDAGELRLMASDNPAFLLGLDPKGPQPPGEVFRG